MMSIGWPLGTNVCSKQRNANTNTNQNHVLINCAWNRMVHARRTLKGSVRMPKDKRFAEKQELAITTRLFFDMHWQQFTHNWNLCAFWNTFQWHWPAQVAKPSTSSVILLLRINLQVMSELGRSGCRTKLPRLACILRNAAKCLAGSLPLQLHSSSMGPCRLASPDICTCDEQDPQPHTTTGSIWLEHAELLAMTSTHHIVYQSCVGQKFLSNNLESSWLIQWWNVNRSDTFETT